MDHKTVLIVDDDLGLCDNLKDILQDEGYEAFSAATYAEGLSLARELKPKAALLDLKLSDGQGTTLLSDLKRLDPDCLCILMTAYADLDSAVVALEKGATHYLQKPVYSAELLRILKGAFEAVQLRDQKLHAEEELRKNEALLKDFLDNANDLIQIVDASGRFIYVNRKWLKVLGYSMEEALKLSISDTIHPDELTHCWDIFRRIMAGETLDTVETLFVAKDGTEICVEGSVSCRLKDGKPVNTRGIFRDITERRHMEKERQKLEAKLQQAQKMEAIGTLAGGIAHDFNNILGVIIGCTELSMFHLPEEATVHRFLRQVLNASNRATDLVQQILTFSRRRDLERKPLQPSIVIKEALKMLRASLPSTIEIHQNIQSDSGMILADPTQIHQILINLSTNAAHAMHDHGGVLEVSLTDVDLDAENAGRYSNMSPGSYLRLTVKDTGHGMDNAMIKRIFDPYFTTKEPGQGTGLGLAVVHGITRSYGGGIGVHSKSGKGTTFHVFLPRIDHINGLDEAEDMSDLPKGDERILFIDDEKELVLIGQKMLEFLGYEVFTTTSSIDALENFHAHPYKFELVITDMTMPNMSGAELARELLHIRPDIPIILCTGFSENITEEKAMDLGIREFIMKPLAIHALADTVRKVLDT